METILKLDSNVRVLVFFEGLFKHNAIAITHII